MNKPIICPYCSSIDNNGRTCFWCGNPVREYTDYESEDNTMTIEMKFTGLTPEQAQRLIKAATETAAEAPNAAPTASDLTAHAPSIPEAPVQQPVTPVTPTAPPVAQVAPAAPAAQVAPVTPVAPVAPVAQTTPAAAPTAVKQYTQDELAVAARPVCELPGGREKLLALLHSFSYTDSSGAVKQVQSIMDMPPEQYPALAAGIRQLGGRI